eukprot:2078408-Prymnesium_polylepis.4
MACGQIAGHCRHRAVSGSIAAGARVPRDLSRQAEHPLARADVGGPAPEDPPTVTRVVHILARVVRAVIHHAAHVAKRAHPRRPRADLARRAVDVSAKPAEVNPTIRVLVDVRRRRLGAGRGGRRPWRRARQREERRALADGEPRLHAHAIPAAEVARAIEDGVVRRQAPLPVLRAPRRRRVALRVVHDRIARPLGPIGEERIGRVRGHGDVQVGPGLAARPLLQVGPVADARVDLCDRAIIKHRRTPREDGERVVRLIIPDRNGQPRPVDEVAADDVAVHGALAAGKCCGGGRA